ncbi:MAG TPA: MMPL family transporter, partial [Solirubrobacteraceae bacterium]|nr:MMPL family transporter [Solirubrobacteraceae bacterium]
MIAARLARAATRHRVALPLATLLAALACGGVGVTVFSRLQPFGGTNPGSSSARTEDAIQRATGAQASPGLSVLLRGRPPIASDPASLARLAAAERVLHADRLVALVQDLHTPGLGPQLVSRAGDATLIYVTFRPRNDRALQDDASVLRGRIERVAPGALVGGLTIANADANHFVEHDLLRAELMAVPVIVLLAFLFFRSLVAALIPPLVGVLSVLLTLLGLRLATQVTDVSVYAVNISTGLGLGLAIDYSLLFVSRYREERTRNGGDVELALRATLSTAGRTVLISSLTVTAALASLLIFPERFLYSMGLGGAIVAASAATVTLAALPALLAALG